MCQRAVSRPTREGKLADYQMVQQQIADSWIQLEQFRLLVLQHRLADRQAQGLQPRSARTSPPSRWPCPRSITTSPPRPLHLHGAIGVSNEMPFMGMVTGAFVMGIADGPTEVHKVTVAKQVLADYPPVERALPRLSHPQPAGGGGGAVRRRPEGAEGTTRRSGWAPRRKAEATA